MLEEVVRQLQRQTVRRQAQPKFDSLNYKASPGQTITFSAESSLTHNDEIVEYRWSLGGAGEYHTSAPTIQHVYAEPFEGEVRLTVLTASGLEETVTAQVMIADPATLPATPSAPHNLELEPVGTNGTRFSWEAADELADKWVISVNDLTLGYVEKDQTSIEVSDVHTNEMTMFSVYAISSDDVAGDSASISLHPERRSMPLPLTVEVRPDLGSRQDEVARTTSRVSDVLNLNFGVADNIFNIPWTNIVGQGGPRPINVLNLGIAAAGLLVIVGVGIVLQYKKAQKS